MKHKEVRLPNPKKILAIWSFALVAIFMIFGLYTLLLHQQVDAMRASSPWTYLKEAEQLRQLNNLPAALRALEKAAELGPKDPLPHQRAGLIFYDTKQWAEALHEYRQALKLGTPEVDTRGKILWCLIRLDRHLEAAEFGVQCIEEGRYTEAFYRYVGEAYRRAGKVPEAIQYYEAARRAEPKDIALMQRLVELYTASADMEKAEHMRQLITDLEAAG